MGEAFILKAGSGMLWLIMLCELSRMNLVYDALTSRSSLTSMISFSVRGMAPTANDYDHNIPTSSAPPSPQPPAAIKASLYARWSDLIDRLHDEDVLQDIAADYNITAVFPTINPTNDDVVIAVFKRFPGYEALGNFPAMEQLIHAYDRVEYYGEFIRFGGGPTPTEASCISHGGSSACPLCGSVAIASSLSQGFDDHATLAYITPHPHDAHAHLGVSCCHCLYDEHEDVLHPPVFTTIPSKDQWRLKHKDNRPLAQPYIVGKHFKSCLGSVDVPTTAAGGDVVSVGCDVGLFLLTPPPQPPSIHLSSGNANHDNYHNNIAIHAICRGQDHYNHLPASPESDDGEESDETDDDNDDAEEEPSPCCQLEHIEVHSHDTWEDYTAMVFDMIWERTMCYRNGATSGFGNCRVVSIGVVKTTVVDASTNNRHTILMARQLLCYAKEEDMLGRGDCGPIIYGNPADATDHQRRPSSLGMLHSGNSKNKSELCILMPQPAISAYILASTAD